MDFFSLTAIAIFVVSFLAIIFDVFPKALITILGALLMIIFHILDFEEAILAIEFETIGLLMGMMIMVDIVESSGVFSWMSVQLAKLTGGKPWLIFLLFILIIAFSSAFLDNVTTLLIVLPILLALTKGIGLNSKIFVVATIFFSIIGGTATLIGDPTNVIIGTSANLSFNDFISNLTLPLSLVSIFVFLILSVRHWNSLCPIKGNLKQLFVSHLMIEKIEHDFGKQELTSSFIIKVLVILGLTILGFIFQPSIGLPVSVIALTGSMVLLLLTTQHASIYKSLAHVEWTTLFFFMGLFIMVAGLEKVGVLSVIGEMFIGLTDNYLSLILVLLWTAGIASMLIDNVPFVTMMIPIVFQIQASLPPDVDGQLLWWALSLGACLGGTGSPIGSSANVIALGIARKNSIELTSFEYIKLAFPLTITMLIVCSLYFVVVI
ncbi:MAG: SLC13 family permease [Candidatus Altimarinota bacterium]